MTGTRSNSSTQGYRSMFDLLPVELMLAIIVDSGLEVEDVRAMRNVSKSSRALISKYLSPVINSLCSPLWGWHCPDAPQEPLLTLGLERKLVQRHDLSLSFPLELRKRQQLSRKLFNSGMLCACSLNFIFTSPSSGGCCGCRTKLVTPVKQTFIRLLWRLGDCGTGCDDARVDVLEQLSTEDLCLFYTGMHTVTTSFMQFDAARRDKLEFEVEHKLRHKRQQELDSPSWEDTALTNAERDALKHQITNDEGHYNERVAVFRDLIMTYGPWLILACFGYQNQEDKELAHGIITETVLKVLRPWEERTMMAGHAPLVMSVNKRFEDILMGRLGTDRMGIQNEVGPHVWSVLDVYKTTEGAKVASHCS